MRPFTYLLLGLLLVVLSIPLAYADHQAFVADLGNGNSVTLSQAPCDNPAVVQHFVSADKAAEFKAATVVWEGKTLAACWAGNAQFVYMLDETGDHGPLPARIFVKHTSVNMHTGKQRST